MSEGPQLPEALSRNIGPLPAGVWLLAIGGGITVAVLVRRRANAEPTADEELAAEDPTSPSFRAGTSNGVDTTYPGAGNLYTPPSNSTGTAPETGSGETVPTTNEQWGQLAIRRAIAKGYSIALVDATVRNYLNGEKLDARMQATLTEIIQSIGAPPIQPPPPATGTVDVPVTDPIIKPKPDKAPPTTKPNPGGTTPTKPKPKPTQTYTVQKGQTLAVIAKRYKVTTQALYGKNRDVIEAAAKRYGRKNSGSGAWIYPGTRLVIP